MQDVIGIFVSWHNLKDLWRNSARAWPSSVCLALQRQHLDGNNCHSCRWFLVRRHCGVPWLSYQSSRIYSLLDLKKLRLWNILAYPSFRNWIKSTWILIDTSKSLRPIWPIQWAMLMCRLYFWPTGVSGKLYDGQSVSLYFSLPFMTCWAGLLSFWMQVLQIFLTMDHRVHTSYSFVTSMENTVPLPGSHVEFIALSTAQSRLNVWPQSKMLLQQRI